MSPSALSSGLSSRNTMNSLLKLIEAIMRRFYPPKSFSTPLPEPTEPTGTPLVASTSPATASSVPKAISTHPGATLENFAFAIRDFEGVPGDLNYRNNNPGNFKCSPVGYLPKYGDVKCKNGFAVFPTYALGWEYLRASIKHRAFKYPTWTILDFCENYAPSSDNNNPNNYAAFIAKRCGVSINTMMSTFKS